MKKLFALILAVLMVLGCVAVASAEQAQTLQLNWEEDPAYADSYFINATSQEQPGVVDRKRVKITDPLAIYSGCYIRASINIYPFNANGNRGIAAGLSNIQFWEDGEPLNGRVRAEDEFDALDDDDADDFLD